MSGSPNQQANILVNQNYVQGNNQAQVQPVEINQEYYQEDNYEQNQEEEYEEDHDNQYQDQEEDDNNQGDEELNQQIQEGYNQINPNQFQQRIQEMQYQQQRLQQAIQEKKLNYQHQLNEENHIREQTEEDLNYDDQPASEGGNRQPQINEDEGEDEDYQNSQQKNFEQNQEQQQNYKSSIQQKRYNQPQQFIDYKTQNEEFHQDQSQSENQQYDEQESSQDQYQQNKNQPQHYFDGQKKQTHPNQRNNETSKHTKNASGSLSSQLDGMMNSSNIVDENSKSIMSKIRQDESQLETSQANVSVSQNNPYDDPYGGQKKHLLDSPGNIELIKHSKYYQKYLNGESLNESYSILPSQTNQNLPSMQNSTSFGDPKGLAAALDQNAQGNELYMLKIKLFESNNKLMQEMNKNRQLRHENSEMKLTIDSLQFQLQQSQQQFSESQKQIQDQHARSQVSHQQSQQQFMMNTFSSPIKSPTFETQAHQSIQQNEALQQRSALLEEEQNKNFNLRQDLENLRTRLLQEMNNGNQYEQQVKEQEKIIKEQQVETQNKNAIIFGKNEEIRKLISTVENQRVEIQNLISIQNKIKTQEEEAVRQKREQTAEINRLIAENKQFQVKLQNYNQDNLRLFSEIQILKQKLEKSNNQVVVHQNQLYNHKAEVSQQQSNLITNKQHSTIIDKFQIEINELKSNLVATSKQLDIQLERNEYLSVRLEEAEKLNKQYHSQKSQNSTSSSTNKMMKRASPPKHRNESDIEYQQRILEHKMIEKHQQLERDYQQKQLELMTQYGSNQNTVKQLHDLDYHIQDQNERTLRQSHSQQIYYENNKARNLDEHNQQLKASEYQQQMRQSLQQNNDYNSQNLNPNQSHHIHSQQCYETVKRDNYISQQQQQQVKSPKMNQSNQNKLPPPQQDHRLSSPPARQTKQNIPPNPNHDYLFYQNLDEEKQKLQKQPQYIPIGVTSVNEDAYVSNTQRIKDLDYYLNQLLQKKKLAESELLKLEESKRKSSMLITQKQELDQRIQAYSVDISNVKNQLRNLHALK